MQGKVEVRDGLGILNMGDTLLVLWRSPATLERWNFQRERIESMSPSCPDGIVFLGLILETSTPPSSQLRSEMQAEFRRIGGNLRRIVFVPLGDSLWLSIVRTIIRGMLLLSGQSVRQRVVATIKKGIDEVRVVAGPQTPSTDQLEAGVGALFAALGVEQPHSTAA